MEAGNWFTGEHRGPGELTLAGCTVAPGFEWEDMDIAGRGVAGEVSKDRTSYLINILVS